MKTRRSPKGSRTTIVSIAVLDLILLVLFLFFSGKLINDIQNSTDLSTIIIASFIIAIPGTLIFLIIIQILNLYKKRFSPGNNFKKNIILYYIFSILLLSVPQSVLSYNFFQASTNNWLNKGVTQSIDFSFNMALNLENERKKSLENLSSNSYFNEIIKSTLSKNDLEITELKTLNNFIDSIEYFDTRGYSLKYLGLKDLKLVEPDIYKKNYFYPNKKIDNIEILRYQYYTTVNSKELIIVLSSILPEGFSDNGKNLTKVKSTLDSIYASKTRFSYIIFLFYLLFTLPLILMAVLGSFIFSDEIIKPIVDIEEAIQKVANGNYSYRILSKKRNEFHLLITSFNKMIKEIEKSRTKLKHTEQISTWQDIATRLAHEIKNPLTPIKLSAQSVLLKADSNNYSPRVKKHMEIIIKEVTRMEKLLNEFRDFARFPILSQKEESIKETIEEAINIYKSTYPNIVFDTSEIEDFLVYIDKSQIIQVISNLTINGIHAMNSAGIISFTSEVVFKKDQYYCRVSVKDNGAGIKKENIPNLFKPYFTTKYDGSGLGLAIVNKIILDHKGKIWIESAENIGTTFYFEFPKEDI